MDVNKACTRVIWCRPWFEILKRYCKCSELTIDSFGKTGADSQVFFTLLCFLQVQQICCRPLTNDQRGGNMSLVTSCSHRIPIAAQLHHFSRMLVLTRPHLGRGSREGIMSLQKKKAPIFMLPNEVSCIRIPKPCILSEPLELPPAVCLSVRHHVLIHEHSDSELDDQLGSTGKKRCRLTCATKTWWWIPRIWEKECLLDPKRDSCSCQSFANYKASGSSETARITLYCLRRTHFLFFFKSNSLKFD